MQRSTSNTHLFALFFAAALLVSGCGGTNFGSMGSVSGVLTLDGKPLAEGTQLLFMNAGKGHAAFGSTDASGAYSLEWQHEGDRNAEVPTGSYKVLIQPPAGMGMADLDADAMLEGADEDLPPLAPGFPERYRQHATSGLEFSLDEGENTINIDLKEDE